MLLVNINLANLEEGIIPLDDNYAVQIEKSDLENHRYHVLKFGAANAKDIRRSFTSRVYDYFEANQSKDIQWIDIVSANVNKRIIISEEILAKLKEDKSFIFLDKKYFCEVYTDTFYVYAIIKYQGLIYMFQDSIYISADKPYKFKGSFEFVEDFIKEQENIELSKKQREEKLESIKGKTPIMEPMKNFDGWEKFDWGYKLAYKKGDKPTFYLPKEIVVSDFKGNIVLHNVDIKLTHNENPYNDLRDLLGSRMSSTFKFKKGTSDILITNEKYNFLTGSRLTVTNGGGHCIYVYDITNVDITKI